MSIRSELVSACLAALFMKEWFDSGSFKAGILMGCSILTTSSFALFYAVLTLLNGSRRAFKIAAMASCLVIPWILRQSFHFHEFVPIRADFGLNFWYGNHEEATGGQGRPSINDAERIPDRLAFVRRFPEHRLSKILLNDAERFIRSHPWRFIALRWKAFLFFWTGERLYTQDRRYLDFAAAPLAPLLLWLAFRNKPNQFLWILILVFPLTYILSIGTDRYRQPMDLILSYYAFY
jgi:hypothetical protein